MRKISLILFSIFILCAAAFGVSTFLSRNGTGEGRLTSMTENLGGPDEPLTHPLQITEMRKQEYPGSDLTIEQTLSAGSNYTRSIASYKSEGLKMFGLLTVPNGHVPEGGWPAIIFNHGYISPSVYSTTERYVAYVDGFARNGYVVFKPDYRGHGNSEGRAEGAYYSTAYTTDVINAMRSVERYPNVNPDKIGMWGHSMGGHITLRTMVATPDIKAGVIWGGVVVSYRDMAEKWRRGDRPPRPTPTFSHSRPGRQQLTERYGTFDEHPEFWRSISPIFFVSDISGPVQLHHGLADTTVPWEFSQSLKTTLDEAGKTAESYTYPGADHNLSGSAFGTAMSRSVSFFDRYLKGE